MGVVTRWRSRSTTIYSPSTIFPDGVVTGVSHDVLTDVGLGGALSIAGGLFSMTDFATGFFTIGGLLQGNPIGDQLFVYEVEATGSSHNFHCRSN